MVLQVGLEAVVNKAHSIPTGGQEEEVLALKEVDCLHETEQVVCKS